MQLSACQYNSIDSQAFISLELLISTSLGIAFSILLVIGFRQQISLQKSNKADFEKSRIFAKSSALLEKILNNQDASRFQILPRIHSQGNITYTDGSINPVSAQIILKAKTNSDAISSLKLNPLKSLKVISYSASLIIACWRYPALGNSLSLNNQNIKGFLAISIDGFAELIGTLNQHSGTSNCFDLQLNSTKSMLVSEPQINRLELVRLLIPIEENFTIYLDCRNQLRFLSHKGASNIENQPILKGIDKISYSLQSNLGILELEQNINFVDGTSKIYKSQNSLAQSLNPTNFYNFLFNL